MSQEQIPACPHCGRSETAWRVQALAAYDYSPLAQPLPQGTARPVNAHTVPQLTRLLKAPVQPRHPAGGLSGMSVRPAYSIGMLTMLIWGVLLVFLVNVVGEQIGPFSTCNFVGLSYLVVLVLINAWRRMQRWLYNKRFPLWQEAMLRWDMLRYCILCDGIFLPGQSQLTPPEQMRQLLYDTGRAAG